MPRTDPLAAAPELLAAIRSDAAHFPSAIQRGGRDYFQEGRVGPLSVQKSSISASVRGSHTYHTAWWWNGDAANPRCTCPAGPVCKHAYALALAIEPALRDPRAAAEPEPGAPAAFAKDGWTDADENGGAAGSVERFERDRASAAAATDLTRWVRQHAESPERSLRAMIGVDFADDATPLPWMQVLVTTPRQRDVARSARQVQQLAAELHHHPGLFAPPQARLLRLLARMVTELEGYGNNTFLLPPSAINRLLDSFAGSALVTLQSGSPDGSDARTGVVSGARMTLGDTSLDVVPMSAGGGSGLNIALAVRWPGGELRRLDQIAYLPSNDPLHPSLAVANGVFWRIADEPPAHVIRRFLHSGALPVPRSGREEFLSLLASSFDTVTEALGPHVRTYPAQPLITFDLGADDWLHVRFFAHTGGPGWRPGSEAPEAIAFELDSTAEWVRFGPGSVSLGDARGATEFHPLAAEEGQAAARFGEPGVPPVATGPGPAPADPSTVWVERPDPEMLEPAREWLGTLPLRRRTGAAAVGEGAEVGERGAWIRLTARTAQVVAEAWDRRPRQVEYLGNARMRNLLAGRRSVRARIAITSSGVDWFTVSAEWQAEGRTLTDTEIARLRHSRTRFVKLSTGWASRDWVEQYDAQADLLADLGLEAGAGEQRVSLAQLVQARPETLTALEELGADAGTREEIGRLRKAVSEFAGMPRLAPPRGLRATLRPYQRDGLDFLAFVTGLGLGAVLADDMGLGKTVQALAWIEWLRERDPDGGPVLVVCPASVVHNWQREAERFTPGLRVLVLASGEERHALRKEVPRHDLIITNYALMRRDAEHWKAIPLRAAILDEAQNIKNPKAAVSRAVMDLNSKRRLALTGTPIENRALDLWSIMQFVNPGYLGRRSEFESTYDRPDSPPWSRRLLAARLRPVMVRRLKEQVAPDLPDRIEERRECELTPGQRRLYLAELVRGREAVERLRREPGGLREHKIEVLALLTRLRQVCCHPALIGGRAELGSGKFEALFEILEPLMAEGRKVLVFSQFVECLKLLAAETKRRGVRHHMLTGATTQREKVVTAFEQDPDPCVFLISLKAGGTGLNLTAAQYVVVFDPWWNPAVEAQAIDRTHRIGQTRTVIAYRLTAAGTVEEKIWELQQRKQKLVKEVLGEDSFAKTLTTGDLEYLLG